MPEEHIKVAIDYGKCRPEKCSKGVCAASQVCPKKLIKQIEPYDFPHIASGFCEECLKCIRACPLNAIYEIR